VNYAIPVISNVLAARHPSPDDVRGLLVQQVMASVRWAESVQYAIAQGCDTVLEVGPGTVLSSLMRRIDRQVRVVPLHERLALSGGPHGIGET
jgi:[acyl-carrier-protein] S-malonyltransferase